MQRTDPCEPDDRLLMSPEASLEACDEGQDDSTVQLAPGNELLGEFTALMADHGRPIRPDLMCGDREYALWQLARARATDDPLLRQLATRLFGWLQASACSLP